MCVDTTRVIIMTSYLGWIAASTSPKRICAYLQCQRAARLGGLRHRLKLFDSLTEVCDPLDDRETSRNCVTSPGLWNDTW